MRYNTNINNVKSLEWGLDIKQAYLFAWMYELPSWADKVLIGDKIYWFASKNKAVDELPLLTDKRDTMYRYYKMLEEKGLIEITKIENKDYITITEKGKEWNKSERSDKNPSKVGNKSELPSDKNPTNNIYKINNINNNNEKNKQKDFETESLNTIPHSQRKDHFLKTFNAGRKAVMNIESNFYTLPTFVLTDLNRLYETYTLRELKDALKGLFLQKNGLSLIYHPKHFLKDGMYETYLDAYVNKNYNIYNDQKNNKPNKMGQL